MTIIETIYKHYKRNYQLTTDSRAVESGMIYIALRGDRFDGNEFAQQALDSGASLVVLDNEAYYSNDDRVILVDDTLDTLQLLAAHHRQALNIPVIALTGSNGKTTTKELMNVALSTKYNVHATTGNFNNHIGVPLTILQATPLHDLMIVEMGANHIDEIWDLCKIASPDVGLITNIGKAHLDGFGGYEGVIKAKSEMYQHLKNKGGSIIYNEDDELLVQLVEDYIPSIPYSPKIDFDLVRAYPILSFQYENKEFDSKLVGGYNLSNIAAAVAVGTVMECTTLDMLEAICNYIPSNNRSQAISKGGIDFVLDAYNANPSSMELSIQGFGESSFESKVLILGDMLELGSESRIEHQKTIVQCTQLTNVEVLFVGPIFKTFEKNNPRFKFFSKVDEIMPLIPKLSKGTNCFVKGSRGIRLEKVLDALV